MPFFDWSEEKNAELKAKRGITFETVLIAIEEGKILDIMEHKNKEKYPQQKIFVIEINNYAYLVPFVESDNKVFLKTIFPSRQATRKYLTHNK